MLPNDTLSEFLIANSNVFCVASFNSSSLFYSKLFFENKKIFYFYMEKSDFFWYDEAIKTLLPLYEKLNITRLNVEL